MTIEIGRCSTMLYWNDRLGHFDIQIRTEIWIEIFRALKSMYKMIDLYATGPPVQRYFLKHMKTIWKFLAIW